MMDDIIPIKPQPLPFSLDDKIIQTVDDEGNVIGDPYSYNDWVALIESISGVNKEFLGKEGE